MNRRTLAFASCSGLLLAASFPVFDLHLLAWIALVPLLIALRGQPLRSAFLLGGVTGLVFFTAAVHWIAYSVHIYGGLSLFVSAFVTLVLCLYLALYPAVFAAALAMVNPRLLFLAAPVFWTILEYARTCLLCGFPWALFGYSQYTVLPVIQIADITGVYGVSFLIVLVNGVIADLLFDRKRRAPLLTGISAVCLVLVYGWVKLAAPAPPATFTISVIQGNIDQDRKWDPAYQRGTFDVYQRLTRKELVLRSDLVVWPETSTPFYFGGSDDDDRRLTDELRAFVKSIKVPLLVGSPTYETRGPGPFILHNSAFLLSPDGTVAASYRKMHLVPFGEYVPLKSVLFFVGKMVQANGEFEPGREYTVMNAPAARGTRVPLSTPICYEIIFPDQVRRFVDRGARIITTITNDAWFGATAAPYQHFSMAVFRAVENRVPVARAANTGVSGFIDDRGRILSASRIFTEASLTHALAPGRIRTFYTAYGDVFAGLCALASAFLLLGQRRYS